MSCRFHAFKKAAPPSLVFPDLPAPEAASYKYYVRGKGCTLGVLFEDSVNIYFEWLTEDGMAVDYPPRLRYKFWSKCDFARLLKAGIWEVSGQSTVTV